MAVQTTNPSWGSYFKAMGWSVASRCADTVFNWGGKRVVKWLLARQDYFDYQTRLGKVSGIVLTGTTALVPPRTDRYATCLPPLRPPPILPALEKLRQAGKARLEGVMLQEFLSALEAFALEEHKAIYQRLVRETAGLPNYIEDIWLKKAYLERRESLVYSNWFGLDTTEPPHYRGDPQLTCAVYMMEGAVRFLDRIRARTLEPFFGSWPIPVDMTCFDRLFQAYRRPVQGCDVLLTSKDHPPGEDYIVVMSQGKYYKVPMRQKREDLYATLQAIREDRSEPPLEIGYLTQVERDTWATYRGQLVANERNKQALETLEGAQLVLCLDEEEAGDLQRLSSIGLLSTRNRHMDAGMQWIVTRDGRGVTNNEHAGTEATAQARMLTDIIKYRDSQLEDGELKAPAEGGTPSFTPLSFIDTGGIHAACAIAQERVEARAQRFHVRTFETAFGKGALKKKGVSPDAFMQMANLLAYRRMTGQWTSVYETAMLRFFQHGRTETVGTLTLEVKDFLETVLRGSAEEARLRTVLKEHHTASFDAMRNRGYERLMLALKTTAEKMSNALPAIFTNEGYLELQKKRLSSSQTPTTEGGGGFLPTERDGFGISYIPREGHFLMTVTSEDLDVDVFIGEHARAMRDLLDLLSDRT